MSLVCLLFVSRSQDLNLSIDEINQKKCNFYALNWKVQTKLLNLENACWTKKCAKMQKKIQDDSIKGEPYQGTKGLLFLILEPLQGAIRTLGIALNFFAVLDKVLLMLCKVSWMDSWLLQLQKRSVVYLFWTMGCSDQGIKLLILTENSLFLYVF